MGLTTTCPQLRTAVVSPDYRGQKDRNNHLRLNIGVLLSEVSTKRGEIFSVNLGQTFIVHIEPTCSSCKIKIPPLKFIYKTAAYRMCQI
jgi:hypothetical protein